MKPVIEFMLACLLVTAAGCSAIAGIFKAGVWTGIVIVVAIVGLILLFVVKARK